MEETHKISWLFPYPGRKNITRLLLDIRQQIQEVKKHNPELEEFVLSNVGMYRDGEAIRVNLYFTRKEKPELVGEKWAHV